ncbi:MAGE-domain-containing protein [Xylariomycetidae sp. FL2044]|nr:MAGE-domain-containing protein [Xylariomycetidae sp. FL2044]
MPPRNTQTRRRTANGDESRRRRQSQRYPDTDVSDASEADPDGDTTMDGASADGTEEQLVKKLVRYALACEYARIPIKRDGIRDKVLGSNARSFKRVFDGAQEQLHNVFGMEMAQLPVREKRSLKEKQKAAARRAASQASTASSRQYILVSTLPRQFKAQPIIGPSRIPSSPEEAAYAGFYTMIISLIVLTGGELSDMKLKRYLTRLNASQNLPIDKTDAVLQKLVRQAYIDKIVERSDGDDDTVTWCVGPRGRVEVPPQSIAAVVKEVWGELPEDFDKKLQRSLGVSEATQLQPEEENAEE